MFTIGVFEVNDSAMIRRPYRILRVVPELELKTDSELIWVRIVGIPFGWRSLEGIRKVFKFGQVIRTDAPTSMGLDGRFCRVWVEVGERSQIPPFRRYVVRRRSGEVDLVKIHFVVEEEEVKSDFHEHIKKMPLINWSNQDEARLNSVVPPPVVPIHNTPALLALPSNQLASKPAKKTARKRKASASNTPSSPLPIPTLRISPGVLTRSQTRQAGIVINDAGTINSPKGGQNKGSKGKEKADTSKEKEAADLRKAAKASRIQKFNEDMHKANRGPGQSSRMKQAGKEVSNASKDSSIEILPNISSEPVAHIDADKLEDENWTVEQGKTYACDISQVTVILEKLVNQGVLKKMIIEGPGKGQRTVIPDRVEDLSPQVSVSTPQKRARTKNAEECAGKKSMLIEADVKLEGEEMELDNVGNENTATPSPPDIPPGFGAEMEGRFTNLAANQRRANQSNTTEGHVTDATSDD